MAALHPPISSYTSCRDTNLTEDFPAHLPAMHSALRARGGTSCASTAMKGHGRMIRVVSWNVFKKWPPWHVLVEMARRGEADVALLQEAGSPPPDLAHPVPYGSDEFWRHEQHEGRPLYDRWCLVVIRS